jgi:predicted PurR-regulated permease PerM
MQKISASVLKQIALLVLIIFTGIILIKELKYFIPGFLGALTLFILFRQSYYNLTEKRKWRKWVASIAIIIGFVVVLLVPIFFIIKLLVPKFEYVFQHSSDWVAKGQQVIAFFQNKFPQLSIGDAEIKGGLERVATLIPNILNATLGATTSVITNILVALFVLYFMLMGGRAIEAYISKVMPLRQANKNTLWKETKNMVISNAVGIPVLMICQGIIAIIGYFIFGVDQAIVWGILTGVASVLPLVGTMIVWVPICIILYANGSPLMALGLTIYCAIVVSNVDNVLRFTIMKKIGDVHPLITVFGVVVGLQLFGIMGLIFGPLLCAYFILLIKIYLLEYAPETHAQVETIGHEAVDQEKDNKQASQEDLQ